VRLENESGGEIRLYRFEENHQKPVLEEKGRVSVRLNIGRKVSSRSREQRQKRSKKKVKMIGRKRRFGSAYG
jgi:hypothetical protein